MAEPRLILLLGDRNGIGPELVAKLLADEALCATAGLEVMGDPDVLAQGQAAAKAAGHGAVRVEAYRPVEGLTSTPGRATEGAGREGLACLSRAARRVMTGEADGVVFAPLNKEALHLGGMAQEDEMRFLADALGYDGVCGELNVLDGLWTTRVTSHVALKDVAAAITGEAVLEATRFAHETLTSAGVAAPRIAVAALNPHAGDGGNFGREEIEVIAPAVEQAAAEGIDAEGPFPADTVFVRARDGRFDAVVTMYHDQGQIAMKLLGFGRGVTVLGGLPVPVTTCGHGTGYDIVGQDLATDEAIRNAFAICREMALSRRDARKGEG